MCGHPNDKIFGMSALTIDVSPERHALLSGRHLGPGGAANWASDLAKAALISVGLPSEAQVDSAPADVEWSVVVRRFDQSVVLIDVNDDPRDHDSIDRLELLATRTWRDVTRNASSAEIRPWLGAIRIGDESGPDGLVVERLEQLVASRILDAVCVVTVDQRAGDVSSPNPTVSIEAFTAALIGRFLVLGTLEDLHPS